MTRRVCGPTCARCRRPRRLTSATWRSSTSRRPRSSRCRRRSNACGASSSSSRRTSTTSSPPSTSSNREQDRVATRTTRRQRRPYTATECRPAVDGGSWFDRRYKNAEARSAGLRPCRRADRASAFVRRCLQVALLLDDGADLLGQQGDVERLLEGVVETELRQAFRAGFVLAGQGDDQRVLEVRVAAQVLRDLQTLGPAHGQVDDDGVRVEALGVHAGLETTLGDVVLVVLGLRQQLLDAVDEQAAGADDQDFVPPLFFEVAQRHAVFLEELD